MKNKTTITTANFEKKDLTGLFRPVFPPGHNPDTNPKLWPEKEDFDTGGTCTPTEGDCVPAFYKLVGGTSAFYTASQQVGTPQAAEVAVMGGPQNPFAVVVCCSDSRVAPEILFSQDLGDLFVVRTAGNVIDSIALASIEYAVLNLQVQLVVFLGHDNCGAITAAASVWANPNPPTPCGSLNAILQSIINTTLEPNAAALAGLNSDPTNQTLLSQAAMWNAQCQAEYAYNNSTIIQYGAQVLYGQVIMAQTGDKTTNGQACGCVSGTLYPYNGTYTGPNRLGTTQNA